MNIRAEKPDDTQRIRLINELAFGQTTEADIVDSLRKECKECTEFLSYVAEEKNEIIGHILFTPVVVESRGKTIQGMGLAPMAVLPARQREGIGSELVRHGLQELRDRGCPFVIVLGHPEYYPKFGFERASKFGLSCQWPGVPDEAFMALILDAARMNGISGVAEYRAEFSAAM